MAVIGALTVNIDASIDGFTSKLGKGIKGITGFAGKVTSLVGALNPLTNQLTVVGKALQYATDLGAEQIDASAPSKLTLWAFKRTS